MYLPYDDAGEEEDKHDDDDSDHSAPRPVGSDKYLVFNQHQHPSHTAHVQ